MVKSKLDPAINYPEIKGIDPEDVDYDASIYEVEVNDVLINVALGKAKYAFVEDSIVYFNAYLVKDDKIVSQIGVYEILEEALPKVTDSEGDPDLTEMSEPLLYDFVTLELLMKSLTTVNSDETEKEKKTNIVEDEVEDEEGEDEDEKQAKKAKKFDDKKAENWVQIFMKNMAYGVKDNEGGGDCFFAAIRDGLSTIGKTVTVMELRNRMSNAATPEMFTQYRQVYDNLAKGLEDVNAQIKQYVEKAKALKVEIEGVTNRSDKAVLLEQAKKLRDDLKKAREEKQSSNEILGEFKWIAKLTSFPKFVKALRTCSFWADDWATSVMERLYNIKVILLSEENFKEGDLNNVIHCGRGDDELLERGIFRPTEYIMMVYTGNHYKLITVDGKGAFTFNELPREMVHIVKNKCLERNAGLYSIIPEFMDGLKVEEEQIEDPGDLHLHGETTVFQFYDQAATKPAPGKGSGEMIGPEGTEAYKGLTGEWRRKLSHGYEKQLKLDEHVWNSVDHYIEGSKFAKENPDFYIQFALDSGSELSKNIGMAKAAAAGKKYEGKVVKPKGVTVDSDWDDERMSKLLEKALAEKFKDPEFANMLKNTRDAKLMLYRKGKPARIETELMRVRSKL